MKRVATQKELTKGEFEQLAKKIAKDELLADIYYSAKAENRPLNAIENAVVSSILYVDYGIEIA